MQVNRVLETCLCVDDLDAAEGFYERVLGLVSFARGEGRHVFFHCGDSVVLLFNPLETRKSNGEVPPHGTTGSGHVAFAMQENEISAWREHLRQNEVDIETEVSWPDGGFSIYFRDPSGNSVELATPSVWGL